MHFAYDVAALDLADESPAISHRPPAISAFPDD
jgi:hypothetical protein